MARTTLDLDPQVLEGLRRLQVREKKTIGRLASDLLDDLEGRVDLADKEAIYEKLDYESFR